MADKYEIVIGVINNEIEEAMKRRRMYMDKVKKGLGSLDSAELTLFQLRKCDTEVKQLYRLSSKISKALENEES